MKKLKKISFKDRIVYSAILIACIPLVLSYSIFINDKLSSNEEQIQKNLREISSLIVSDTFVQEKLFSKMNDKTLQRYTKSIIEIFEDVDIVVIGDMEGEKYSHLDETQIGDEYVNPDNHDVLVNGESYYSLMEGSMGKTFRWFEPIKYKGEQVGFIMIGKYNQTISKINTNTMFSYVGLLIISVIITTGISLIFANKIKAAIFNMEPEEIATLYSQKKIVIDSVKDGIIALDKDNKITEVNQICYELIPNFACDKIIHRLSYYIEERQSLQMKEFILQGKKIFVTMQPIFNNEQYLGIIITLSDREDINKVAKEITGIDETLKNLRATVHEFKNNLHVILGLLEIKEYSKAKEYIAQINHVHTVHLNKISTIKDPYVNALLMSRELVAKEKQVTLKLVEESFLQETHDYIDSHDLVTIIGNLIENAMEACVSSNNSDKVVEVSLYEDEQLIEIEVMDNGISIDEDIKEKLLLEGVSSKGESRGVGLSLVKSRVDVYNGTIRVKPFKSHKVFKVILLKKE